MDSFPSELLASGFLGRGRESKEKTDSSQEKKEEKKRRLNPVQKLAGCLAHWSKKKLTSSCFAEKDLGLAK